MLGEERGEGSASRRVKVGQARSIHQWNELALRSGLRQLPYQHCFRVGQPAPPLPTLHPTLPAPLLHYLLASLSLSSPVWLVLISPLSPFHMLISILFSVSHCSSLSSLSSSPASAERMNDDSSSWPEYISSPASLFPDSSDLVRTGEWDVHFYSCKKAARAAAWVSLFSVSFTLFSLYPKMDVHKHIIIRGWSLRGELPAPKHLTSVLHVCLFLSEGLEVGFWDSFLNFFRRKTFYKCSIIAWPISGTTHPLKAHLDFYTSYKNQLPYSIMLHGTIKWAH